MEYVERVGGGGNKDRHVGKRKGRGSTHLRSHRRLFSLRFIP